MTASSTNTQFRAASNFHTFASATGSILGLAGITSEPSGPATSGSDTKPTPSEVSSSLLLAQETQSPELHPKRDGSLRSLHDRLAQQHTPALKPLVLPTSTAAASSYPSTQAQRPTLRRMHTVAASSGFDSPSSSSSSAYSSDLNSGGSSDTPSFFPPNRPISHASHPRNVNVAPLVRMASFPSSTASISASASVHSCSSSCCPPNFPVPNSAPIFPFPPPRWGRYAVGSSPPTNLRTLTPTMSQASFPCSTPFSSSSLSLFPTDPYTLPPYSVKDKDSLDSFVRSFTKESSSDLVSHKTFFHDTSKLDHFISLPHTGNHGHALSTLVSRVVEAWLRNSVSGGRLVEQEREEMEKRILRRSSLPENSMFHTEEGYFLPESPNRAKLSRRSSFEVGVLPTKPMSLVDMLLWKLGEDKKKLTGVSKMYIQVQRNRSHGDPSAVPSTPPIELETIDCDADKFKSHESCIPPKIEESKKILLDESLEYPLFYGASHMKRLMKSRVVQECFEELPCLHDVVVVVRHDAGFERIESSGLGSPTLSTSSFMVGSTEVWIMLNGLTGAVVEGLNDEPDGEMIVHAEI